ncbi:BQ2448_4897 [Microbotryum intermedium]|uniref:BQ2448_4897 protein n=1 Tax=Microbotryum intermedium TaxID=269621 RepID=A0A238FJM5_9BASI|nr:BQ2448_4897 [Microbotryum intermedium]
MATTSRSLLVVPSLCRSSLLRTSSILRGAASSTSSTSLLSRAIACSCASTSNAWQPPPLLIRRNASSTSSTASALPRVASLLSTRQSASSMAPSPWTALEHRIEYPRRLLTTTTTTTTYDLANGTTTQTAPDPPEIALTTPVVSKYLFVIAAMVFCIVVVGGMTRLTESGLSITEWNVVSGVLPPLGAADWESEFAKYRATPEFRLQNAHITIDEFKSIYYWEWAHRILGRVIGLTFLLPIPYFYMRRKVSPRIALSLLGIGTLIGAQGVLGWYMVKSGLDEKSVKDLGGVARVSQYRLAAHLGMAFAVYASCVRLAWGIGRDWKLASLGKGLGGWATPEETIHGLQSKTVGRVRAVVTVVSALVFLTALSGAFVAGLDAGLVYNEFPLMGGRLVPATKELIDDHYARKSDKSDMWRNLFENPTTVQFDHRLLATTTFAAIVSLFLYARRPSIRAHLPPTTLRLIKGTMHMSILQVTLGISTLIYLVPIHLAATHQAGSLVLLTLALASGASLRRPSKVARELMRVKKMGQFTKP